MKHEIMDVDTGVRLEVAVGPQLLLFVPVVLMLPSHWILLPSDKPLQYEKEWLHPWFCI